MNNAIIIDRNGNTIDDEGIVPDGGSVRVAMPFMDSVVTAALARVFGDSARGGNSRVLHDGTGGPAGFRPGYAFGGMTPFAHHQRADHARAAYLDTVSNAWRSPPALEPPKPPVAKPARAGDASDGKESAQQRYVANLSTAWKTAT